MSSEDIYHLMQKTRERHKKLVNTYEVIEVLPCIRDPNRIRLIAKLDHEIGDAIPYVALRFPPGKVTYAEKEGVLTLNVYDRLITLFPEGKISMTYTKDLDEAKEIIEEFMGLINEAYEEAVEKGKKYAEEYVKRLKSINWMELYKYLPQTNCGECGEQTCAALAMKALQGEAKLSSCKPLLNDPRYAKNLKELRERLGPYLCKTLGLE